MNRFCVLTTRFGRDIPDPTSDDLQMALNEVFSLDDDEHPNSWLRYGSDSGQMFVLDVYQSSRIIFTQWADIVTTPISLTVMARCFHLTSL